MDFSLVLLYNSQTFVIELNYGYRYLHNLHSELSDIYFMIWLRYRPVLAMVNILALELWQLL